jgi:phosphatidate phosphatase PAH1
MMPNFDFTFEDLYNTEGLKRLDAHFLAWLEGTTLEGEATSSQSSTSQSSTSQSSGSQSSTSQSSTSQSSASQLSTSQSSASQSSTSQSSASQNASSPNTASQKHSLATAILEARTTPLADHSDLILRLAPHLEDFLGELFQKG